jgi:glycosyltransferase involved in cell wall biosynthesis
MGHILKQLSNVTVLIPNLNGGKFLEAALISCLEQTHSCDILVVDNGSTDNSLDILKKYSEKYENVSFLKMPEKGISNALNYGLSRIDTEFICRLDSDDVMVPWRVQVQVTEMIENPNLILVGSQVEYIERLQTQKRYSSYPSDSDSIKRAMCWSNPIAHPSVVLRTRFIREAGGYKARFDGAEDFDLWLRLMGSGDFLNLKLPLTKYRIHEGQTSQTSRLEKVEIKVRLSWFRKNFLTSRQSIGFKFLFILRIFDLLLSSIGFSLHRSLFRKFLKR